MCFNAPVSLTAFLVGSVLAIAVGIVALRLGYTSLAVLSFAWIWVIAMQWWEYMVWRQWHTETATRLAYVFNVMQIPLLFLLFFHGQQNKTFSILASTVLAGYLIAMFYPMDEITSIQQTSSGTSTIEHLRYSWWEPSWKALVYFVGLCSVFLLLVRPLPWSCACLVTLLVLFAWSGILYGMESIASLWCFFAVFFPVIALCLRLWLPGIATTQA